MPRTLNLPQEILLLALHDEKGTASASFYTYAMAGGALAELLFEGHAELEGEGARARVRPAGSTASSAPHDTVLAEALEKVRAKPGRADATVSRIARLPNFPEKVARSLVQRGVLRAREEKMLLLFSRTTWPTVDPAPERELVARLRTAVLEERGPVEPRTATLLALLSAGDMLRTVLGKGEVKAARPRIDAIREGSAVDDGGVAAAATRGAVQAVQAALVAVMASSIAINAST